jgi:hypothetical protein
MARFFGARQYFLVPLPLFLLVARLVMLGTMGMVAIQSAQDQPEQWDPIFAVEITEKYNKYLRAG